MMAGRCDACARTDRRPGRVRRMHTALLVVALFGPWTATTGLAGSGTRFDVALEEGSPRQGERTLTATAGDTVSIRVRSDHAVTLHLHGYDRELAVPADGEATLRFDAAIPGRFPIEMHGGHGHGPILYLEVRPD